jgi:hypothetical protein
MLPKTKISLEEGLDFWYKCDLIGQDKRKNLESYCKEHKIAYHFKTVGIDEVAIFYYPDKIIIAIDGSDKDMREWKGNFSAYGKAVNLVKWLFKKNQNPESKNGYHQDYYNSAMLIREWAYGLIHPDDPRDIVWAGHSRGAGIAQICYLEDENTEEQMCVPFASPRCMLKWRAKYLKKNKSKYNIQSFFIKGDIVDNVPPFFLGWRHFYSFKTKLPRVKGFNHTSIGKALKKAIRKRDGRAKAN